MTDTLPRIRYEFQRIPRLWLQTGRVLGETPGPGPVRLYGSDPDQPRRALLVDPSDTDFLLALGDGPAGCLMTWRARRLLALPLPGHRTPAIVDAFRRWGTQSTGLRDVILLHAIGDFALGENAPPFPPALFDPLVAMTVMPGYTLGNTALGMPVQVDEEPLRRARRRLVHHWARLWLGLDLARGAHRRPLLRYVAIRRRHATLGDLMLQAELLDGNHLDCGTGGEESKLAWLRELPAPAWQRR